jgi:hypothetical protein
MVRVPRRFGLERLTVNQNAVPQSAADAESSDPIFKQEARPDEVCAATDYRALLLACGALQVGGNAVLRLACATFKEGC